MTPTKTRTRSQRCALVPTTQSTNEHLLQLTKITVFELPLLPSEQHDVISPTRVLLKKSK